MRNDKATVDDFLAQRRLAVAGVSRDRRKFGNAAFRELKAQGYEVYPLNPARESAEDGPCWSSLADLPRPVDGLLVVTPPAQTLKLVAEAAQIGVLRIWMQQGAQSREAIALAKEKGMQVVAGECILMHAQPRGFHRFHRGLWGLLGKLPR
jgi:hypothetical protein